MAVFIDGSNFYHALRDTFHKTQVKFDLLATKLTDRLPNRKLVRVYYYNAVADQDDGSEQYKGQQKFLEYLRRTPYVQLKLGRLERRPISEWAALSADQLKKIEEIIGRPLKNYTHVEKGIDVQMSVDMLRLAINNTYDTAVIISGDGDFAPAIEAVKELGKHVELGRVANWPCNRLRDACDVEVPIDADLLADCWI